MRAQGEDYRPAWAGIVVDDVHHRRLQLGPGDVLSIDPAQRLRCCHLWRMPGGLARAEIAAVTEHGEQVALDGLGELGIGAGWRPHLIAAGVAKAAHDGQRVQQAAILGSPTARP